MEQAAFQKGRKREKTCAEDKEEGMDYVFTTGKRAERAYSSAQKDASRQRRERC